MLMLDTHIAAALYQGKTAGISAKTIAKLDREPLSISPAVLLELELLHEIGRIKVGAGAIAAFLAQRLSIYVAAERFSDVLQSALPLAFSRDPFDRLIVAHADLLKAPLVSLDGVIQRHYARALN